MGLFEPNGPGGRGAIEIGNELPRNKLLWYLKSFVTPDRGTRLRVAVSILLFWIPARVPRSGMTNI